MSTFILSLTGKYEKDKKTEFKTIFSAGAELSLINITVHLEDF